MKSPTNQYISFTLRQEVVRKHYSTAAPHTTPVTARNAPVWAHSHHIGAVLGPAKYRPKFPAFRGFFILPQRHLPERDFPVQVNPTQINKILRYYRILSVKSRKVGFFPLWFCCDAYNLTPESTTYDCTKSACCGIIYLCQQHKSAGIKNAAAVAQRNHSGIVFAFYTLTFTTIFFTAQGPAVVWRRGAWASSGGTMAKSPAFRIMQPLSAGSS